MTGAVIVCPTQYVEGVNVTAGAKGMALMVKVTGVAGPVQLAAEVWVTYTVVVPAAALLKPSCAFVGVVPVVSKVVNPASLYQRYVLDPTGLETEGAVMVCPIQYEDGVKFIVGAAGSGLS